MSVPNTRRTDDVTVVCAMLNHLDIPVEADGEPAILCARCGRIEVQSRHETPASVAIGGLVALAVMLVIYGILVMVVPYPGVQ